jgi:hypothetical protein
MDKLVELFRLGSSETATCVACGEVLEKIQMIYDEAYGWFCNQQELDEQWLMNQT